jgi:hypothetical protein
MSDNPIPEDLAFEADLDRLRAQVGAARLEEGARRGIGDQMLTDALLATMAANEQARHMRSRDLWSRPAEPNWGWEDDE